MMDLALRIDREKWRVVPRPLKIVFLVILVELAVLFSLFLLGDSLGELETHVAQLRVQLGQLRQKNNELRQQVGQYPQLRRSYDLALGKGLVGTQNGVKLVADAQDLAARHSLTNFRYKVEVLASQPTPLAKYRLGVDLATFESGALLDIDALAFWDDLLGALPAHYHVVEASLERSGDVDNALLADIRAGRTTSPVRMKISFLWFALSPTLQETP